MEARIQGEASLHPCGSGPQAHEVSPLLSYVIASPVCLYLSMVVGLGITGLVLELPHLGIWVTFYPLIN